MDAARQRARAVAHDGDHAGPDAAGVEVGEIGIVQEVGAGGVTQAAALQIDLGDRARERCAAGKNPGDLMTVVGLRGSGGPRRRRTIQARAPCRFLEQGDIGKPGGEMDGVDRTGAFAGRVIVAVAGARAAQVDDARALIARRTPREVGAAQGLAVGRPAGVRKQRRQPVGCRRTKPRAHFVEVVPDGRPPDLVQIDHDRITSPRSARVMTV